MTTAFELASAKLAESALDLNDARVLGIDVLDVTQVRPLVGVAMPALRFSYHRLNGEPRDDLFRLRVLGPPPVGAFGEQLQPMRYWQPIGSPVGVYYAQNLPRPWAEVAASPDVPLVITEGELKAAAGCKAGIATLALGGVWNWCNRKLGSSFLADLDLFAWGRRITTICFDSDAFCNHNIATALAALGVQLRDRGTELLVAQLPELVPGKKCGLDDFLVARGVDALKDVLNSAAAFDDLSRYLLEYNSRFVYVANPGKLVYDVSEDQLLASDTFIEVHGNMHALKLSPGNGPTGQKRTEVSVAREWINWRSRRTFSKMTYAPGQAKLISSTPGRYLVNRWPGWGCDPRPGDVAPWTTLLDHLFTGATPEVRQWFERWCAYPLQHPGTKMTSACGMWSRKQGQGKSLVGVTLGKIYGANYILIGESALEDAFNYWADAHQFVLVDDITGQDTRARADLFKKLITQREMVVNLKYQPQYVLPDCVNYYITSNRPNCFFIDDEDRRFFVHEVTVGRLEQAFYDAYNDWLEAAGPAALFAYLLALPLEDFSPYVAPPMTSAKQAMIEAVRSDLDVWIDELLTCSEAKLRLGAVALRRDLYTTRELLSMYAQESNGRPPSVAAMANALGAKFKLVNDGRQIKIDGRPTRLWIVRNLEAWLSASPAQVAAHVVEMRTQESGHGVR